MSTPKTALSFLQFLNDARWEQVKIPIIQRDYAQGRPGAEMEQLRKRFLDSLFEALEVGDKKLVLDFVYGCVEKEDVNIFCPLDGQQRLTTLWLLHWYLAFRAGDMSIQDSPKIQDSLKKFSYETRYSSRIFCDKLCGMLSATPSAPESVAEYIRQSRWFFRSYRQDPTISGMLRMLGDIESRFKQTAGENAEGVARGYLKKLKGEEAPITFYTTVLTRHGERTEESSKSTELPLTDDLYIKMNARGKALTPYENFKADLLAHLKSKGIKVDELARLLDGEVTELFWRSKLDCHIDEIMLVFFSRFFHCRYIAHARDAKKDQLMDAAALTQDKHYISLNVPAGLGDTEPLTYSGFEAYKEVFSLKENCAENLKSCLSNLVKLYQCQESNVKSYKQANDSTLRMLFCPPWENQDKQEENKRDIPLIPQYKQDSAENHFRVRQFTWKELTVFYGICLYLIHGKLTEKEKLQEWMRFVWNMAENCVVYEENALNLIRYFDKIALKVKEASDIETYLAGLFHAETLNGSLSDSWASLREELGHQEQAAIRQLHEEVFKAHLIEQGVIPKEYIREAEKFAFFNGAIAFLLTNMYGKLSAVRLLFEIKWNAVQAIFRANGLTADRLNVFYSWCRNDQLERGGHIFNMLMTTWRDNICLRVVDKNYLFAEPLHALLVGWKPKTDMDKIAEFLSHPEMVISFSNRSKCYLRRGYDDCLKLHPNRKPDEGVFLEGAGRERDGKIAGWLEGKKVTLCDSDKAVWIEEERQKKLHCIWGRDVDLEFEKTRLRWRILRVDDPGVNLQASPHRFYLLNKPGVYVDKNSSTLNSLVEIVSELNKAAAEKTHPPHPAQAPS